MIRLCHASRALLVSIFQLQESQPGGAGFIIRAKSRSASPLGAISMPACIGNRPNAADWKGIDLVETGSSAIAGLGGHAGMHQENHDREPDKTGGYQSRDQLGPAVHVPLATKARSRRRRLIVPAYWSAPWSAFMSLRRLVHSCADRLFRVGYENRSKSDPIPAIRVKSRAGSAGDGCYGEAENTCRSGLSMRALLQRRAAGPELNIQYPAGQASASARASAHPGR